LPELKKEKFYDLYYLDDSNLFITIADESDNGELLQDEVLIRQYSETYLKTVLPPIEFIPIETEVGIEYESDTKDLTVEIVIARGTKLETKESVVIYYFKQFDFFVAIELLPVPGSTTIDNKFGYVFQDNSLRKKYSIPYQDERFQGLLL
jgi:hypothetical protein